MVVALSAITMLGELYFGYKAGSVALIMEGWHMMSHVLVILLAWGAYWYALHRHGSVSHQQEHRIFAVSAFASALVLLTVTLFMVWDAVEQLRSPNIADANGALLVAFIGLLVNGISAFFLHREEEKTDLNLRAAYLHVMSDVVISVLAIVALLGADLTGWLWLDPVCALLGAAIIAKWSVDLISSSGKEVL